MSNITNEIIFKGSFITGDADGFIAKLNQFLHENNIEFKGKVLVFPIEGYTEYEEVNEEDTNNCETKLEPNEETSNTDTNLQS